MADDSSVVCIPSRTHETERPGASGSNNQQRNHSNPQSAEQQPAERQDERHDQRIDRREVLLVVDERTMIEHRRAGHIYGDTGLGNFLLDKRIQGSDQRAFTVDRVAAALDLDHDGSRRAVPGDEAWGNQLVLRSILAAAVPNPVQPLRDLRIRNRTTGSRSKSSSERTRCTWGARAACSTIRSIVKKVSSLNTSPSSASNTISSAAKRAVNSS